jgi:hypothetical protein
MLKNLFVSIILFAGTLCGESLAKDEIPPKPLTVLISIDGFKPEYLKRGLTSNLSQLAQLGVVAEGMFPVFPSVTFPNHISLVTGVDPDQHGIVNNVMKDPTIPNARFMLSDRSVLSDPKWWTEVRPIWITAHEQHKISSTLFWPGSDVLIGGVQPEDWLLYKEIPSHERVVKLLDWLDRPSEKRADFATLYFSEVDYFGHMFGPNSAEVNASISNVDAEIGNFLEGLKKLNLDGVTNLVIVSDHGMASTSRERVIVLSELAPELPKSGIVWTGAVGGIEVEGAKAKDFLFQLGKDNQMDCWLKEEMPERFHFGSHRRIPKIVCLAKVGWTIVNSRKDVVIAGQHGFDPDEVDMRALFIATGPKIINQMLGVVNVTDVYNLLCVLIGIVPENNATSNKLLKIVRE